jgi:hypothetical protein
MRHLEVPPQRTALTHTTENFTRNVVAALSLEQLGYHLVRHLVPWSYFHFNALFLQSENTCGCVPNGVVVVVVAAVAVVAAAMVITVRDS